MNKTVGVSIDTEVAELLDQVAKKVESKLHIKLKRPGTIEYLAKKELAENE